MSEFRIDRDEELLTRKQLEQALKRSHVFIQQMVNTGFPMPGGRATLSEARRWLHAHGWSFGVSYIRKNTKQNKTKLN